VDMVHPEMLRAPDDQYLYANMMRWNGMRFLEKITGVGVEIPGREVNGTGAAPADFERDRAATSNPILSSLFSVQYDTLGGKSKTMRFNRPVYSNSTSTMKSREIKVGQKVSTTPMAIQGAQTTLTVVREGGPYSDDGSEIRPFSIDEFDAEHGVHNLVEYVGEHLRRDNVRCKEKWTVDMFDQFDAIYPVNMTAENDMVTKGSGNFNFNFIIRAGKEMADRKLPTFPGGKWLMVITTDQEMQLLQDPVYRQWAHDHPNFNPLFPGHIGAIRDFEVFRSTTLTVSKNTNSSPIYINHGHILAPGAIGYGMGTPPRVRNTSDDNYGLNPAFIWEEKLALGLTDQSFGLKIVTSESAV
jgi:hypothetical protein